MKSTRVAVVWFTAGCMAGYLLAGLSPCKLTALDKSNGLHADTSDGQPSASLDEQRALRSRISALEAAQAAFSNERTGLLSKIAAAESEVVRLTGELAGWQASGIALVQNRGPAGNLQSEGYAVNGKKLGLWVEYSDDGRKSAEMVFVEGKRYGGYRKYSSSGLLIESGNYIEDHRIGTWFFYNPGSNSWSTVDYVGNEDSLESTTK